MLRELDSAEPTEAPEPAALGFVGLGLIGIIALRRHQAAWIKGIWSQRAVTLGRRFHEEEPNGGTHVDMATAPLN